MKEKLVLNVTMEADTRYSFTAQFLCASAIFSRQCAEIESLQPVNSNNKILTEHRGLVTAAIMQCVAAIEAESAELTMHGPGAHLGSNGTDMAAKKILEPLADFIDGQQPLDKFQIILHILSKPPMEKGDKIWEDMALLIKLRNELIHYKSKLGKEMDSKKLFKSLEGLKLAKPPFASLQANFFPHQFLGAACAVWSVRTSVAFLNSFYDHLGIESCLKGYMGQFKGL